MRAFVHLRDPVDPRAFQDALAENAGVPVHLQVHAPTRFEVALQLELDPFLLAVDDLELDGTALRGRLTLELVGDPSTFRNEPDGLAFVTDAERSLAGRALSIAGGAAMEGDGAFHLLPDDGAFTVERERLTLWVRHSLLPGPLARALGTRGGRVPLGSLALDGPPPPAVAAFPGDPTETDPVICGPQPPLVCPDRTRLHHDLTALGLQRGDLVMVHASLRTVGVRAEVLLDALESVVGPEGTLLLLLCADPNEPFSPTSRAWSDLGVLPETARTRSGWRCNDHPFARMAAWGAQADALLMDGPLDDYYGPGSPLERLVQAGGRVVRLGSDTNTTTLFHYAEYQADLPHARRVEHTVEVATPDGVRTLHASCLEDSFGIFPWDGSDDYFRDLLATAMASGAGTRGRVGHADAELLEAPAAVEAAVAWLRAHAPG